MNLTAHQKHRSSVGDRETLWSEGDENDLVLIEVVVHKLILV